MAQEIDMTKIRKYAPTDPVAQRIYEYLKRVAEKELGTLFSREELLAVGTKAGLNRNVVYGALKHLENVVDVISFWDGNARTVFYMFVPMTPEEKIASIESDIWFETLP